jgi:hypothetical protein
MSFPQPKSISGPLSDSLAYYVYLLIDLRDGKVFYVGKEAEHGVRPLPVKSRD